MTKTHTKTKTRWFVKSIFLLIAQNAPQTLKSPNLEFSHRAQSTFDITVCISLGVFTETALHTIEDNALEKRHILMRLTYLALQNNLTLCHMKFYYTVE